MKAIWIFAAVAAVGVLFAGETVVLPWSENLNRVERFEKNCSGELTISKDAKENAIRFDAEFTPGTDFWCYPRLRLAAGESLAGIRGTARLLGKKAAEAFDPGDRYLFLPSYEETLADKDALMRATIMVEQEMNFQSGRGLLQKYGDRLLVVEPPPEPLKPEELDRVHELPYARRPHPKYKGRIPAFETIKDSIQAVRGCPGGCAFCGLVVHQGRHVMSRSEDSVLRELDTIAKCPNFKGTISDVGGAAGNIYGSRYDLERCRKCRRSSCLFPAPCPNYVCTGLETLHLLRRMRKHPKVKHLYINSGIRLDLALRQPELLREIIAHHVNIYGSLWL